MSAVGLRSATSADIAFLGEVYASTRTAELNPVPWTDDQKRAFLRQQFEAQHLAYHDSYPDAAFDVITLDLVPIGRLYVTPLGDDELRVIDIALLPEHRNRGIGSRLIETVIARADREHRSVSLHVELWNPAIGLYERLGFHRGAQTEVYLRMDRPPMSIDAGTIS